MPSVVRAGCRLMYLAATSNESVDDELEEKKV